MPPRFAYCTVGFRSLSIWSFKIVSDFVLSPRHSLRRSQGRISDLVAAVPRWATFCSPHPGLHCAPQDWVKPSLDGLVRDGVSQPERRIRPNFERSGRGAWALIQTWAAIRCGSSGQRLHRPGWNDSMVAQTSYGYMSRLLCSEAPVGATGPLAQGGAERNPGSRAILAREAPDGAQETCA